jgi:hypothetical protein
MTFIIKIFTRIKDTGENKMIVHFFPIFSDFFNKILLISVTPHGPKCKHGSFCSICYKPSGYCSLEITLWGKQGLLVIQKTILFTGKSFTDFRQNLRFLSPVEYTNRVWDIRNDKL